MVRWLELLMTLRLVILALSCQNTDSPQIEANNGTVVAISITYEI
jgi:hypothetical protein